MITKRLGLDGTSMTAYEGLSQITVLRTLKLFQFKDSEPRVSNIFIT